MRVCLFCENPATRREHAWPEWLVELVRQKQPATTALVRGPNGVTETWRARDITIKIRCVCRDCNSGWMSDLESGVRKVVGAMVTDLSVLLTPDDQALVARWAVKTAMVFEAVQPGGPKFYDDTSRRGLRRRLPPEDTLVWLGRQPTSDRGDAEGRRLSGVGDPVLPYEGYASTFSVGHFVFQIFSGKRGPELAKRRMTIQCRQGPWSACLRQVWPPAGPPVFWPPPLSISDSGPSFDQLAARFRAG